MDSLFSPAVAPNDIPPIPGLRYFPDYIDARQERDLLDAIDRLPWNTTWQRRRQPYGGGYGNSGEGLPIPEWGQILADRMFAENITPQPFGHMLVNEYLPGQGIASHVDYKPYGRSVVSLSLMSPCVMDFRRRQDDLRHQLLLERRSLLALNDEARFEWEHGIAARKKDAWQGLPIVRGRRLSITFRFVSS